VIQTEDNKNERRYNCLSIRAASELASDQNFDLRSLTSPPLLGITSDLNLFQEMNSSIQSCLFLLGFTDQTLRNPLANRIFASKHPNKHPAPVFSQALLRCCSGAE
jgi:hypothetical protein